MYIQKGTQKTQKIAMNITVGGWILSVVLC